MNTPIAATLHTDQKLVDVTTIVYDSSAKQYDVTTFKAVDPSGWVTALANGFVIPDYNTSSSRATLYYTNPPPNPKNYYWLADDVTGGFLYGYYSVNPSYPQQNNLQITYNRHDSNDVYLLLPELCEMEPGNPVANLVLAPGFAFDRKRSTDSASGPTVQKPSPILAATSIAFGPKPETRIGGGGSGRS